MKAAIIVGLAALTLSACGIPQYKTAGPYECEMYGSRISAKIGNKIVTKDIVDKIVTKTNYNKSEYNLTYPKNMTLETAVKAIETCERAFAKKAEMDEQ